MRRRVLWIPFLLVGVWVIGAAGVSSAESANTFEFSFSADKKIITLGEEVTLSLHFLASDQFEILPVEDHGQFRPLEVNSITHNVTPSVKSIRSESYTIKLTTFAFGAYEIDAFPVQFRIKGGDIRTVYTNPFTVQCVSVVGSASELKEIKPIKGQESLDDKPLPLWMVILLTGIGLILLFSIIKAVPIWIANWKERQLTPFERAMKKMKQLADSGAENNLSVYQFYIDLSSAFRDALILGCGVGSANMTTNEWEQYALQNSVLSPHREAISKILRASDMAKFAGARFDPEVSRATAQSAVELTESLYNRLSKPDSEKK